MGRSISKYHFENVKNGMPVNLETGVFIWMLNAHKRPPHFVLSLEGKVYGISLKGSSIGKDISIYSNLIKNKSIPTMFVELKNIQIQNTSIENLKNHIQKNPKVEVDGLTCLDPICYFISETTGLDLSGVERIFDLLDILEENYLSQFYSVGMPVLNGELLIDKYTKEDIRQGILKVQRKYALIRE